MKSDTPETDREVDNFLPDGSELSVSAIFAERLERERNKALQKVTELEARLWQEAKERHERGTE